MISESWLSNDVSVNEVALSSHELFRSDRPEITQRGGIVVYVKDTLLVFPTSPLPIISEIDAVSVLVSQKRHKILIFFVYINRPSLLHNLFNSC